MPAFFQNEICKGMLMFDLTVENRPHHRATIVKPTCETVAEESWRCKVEQY